MKKDLTPKYVLGMSIFLYFVLAFVGGIFGNVIAFYTKDGATAVSCSVIFCDAVLILLYYNMMNRSGLTRISLPPAKDIIIIFIGLTAIILFDTAFVSSLSAGSFDTSELEFWGDISRESNIIINILATVILAPILEEILFRGILFGVIKHYIGFGWALIISSVAFGVAHGIGLYTIIGAVCGIVLTCSYELSGTLLIPIAIHMLNNLLSEFETAFGEVSFLIDFDSNNLNVICVVVAYMIAISIVAFLLTKCAGIQPGSNKDYCKEQRKNT